jgi:hypothetical protein
LKWGTASEQHTDRFEVERSPDGEHYASIGAVPAAGHSTEMTHYSFLDVRPYPGLNHYRLRQLDIHGEDAYSPARIVMIPIAGEAARLVPNPGSGLVDVLFVHPGGARLLMLDATGRQVLHTDLERDRTPINVSGLPSGVYLFRVLSPSGDALAHGTWLRQ